MYSIIVVPPGCRGAGDQIRLAPGEKLTFGRSPGRRGRGAGPHLPLAHDGISRAAGEITAHCAFWLLSNLSPGQTYVVENPEGAGEHVKVAPGRLDAPVPFEFSRLVLPAAGDLLGVEVWAPRHDYVDAAPQVADGPCTVPAFSLDRTKRYFAVLVALCEPRLRGAPHAPLPTAEQVVERLRPGWPGANRGAVQWNIDYLAVKLRLKPGPDDVATSRRLNGKRELLVSLALRFDLVREDDLAGLRAPAQPPAPTPAPRDVTG